MAAQISAKAVSSLEKCFWDEPLESKEELTHLTVFQNQKPCYQLMLCKNDETPFKSRFNLRFSGDLAPYASMRQVISMPVRFPYNKSDCDDDYLRYEPGLYPDLLQPLHYQGRISLTEGQPQTLFVDAELPEDFPAGTYTLSVEVSDEKTGELYATNTVSIRVLGQKLPPQTLIHTEWFYTDCIANYYHVRAFSEKHWKLLENFIRTAVENGVNMILTPIFTPELDTYVGGERMTTQLLGITVEGKNRYSFDFSGVERWIDLCLSLGVEYFEIPHFFSQWGALHAPKIVASVNGRKKKIFGWDTDSAGEEYTGFLSQMITALVDFLEKKGVASHTYFHISDEPSVKNLDQYLRCKGKIAPYIKDYPVIDALSDYEFYTSGALRTPIPGIRHIDPFLENKVKDLWAYYCGASGAHITGRMFAMSLARTRILGVQLWKYNIKGFLHWGYNYYNNQFSYDPVNPFLHTSGEFFAPAGDSYLVYPGDDGTAWESLRSNAMREAMEDMRLLQLAEEKLGRETVEAIVTDEAGQEITFRSYPKDTNFLIRLQNRLIAELGI